MAANLPSAVVTLQATVYQQLIDELATLRQQLGRASHRNTDEEALEKSQAIIERLSENIPGMLYQTQVEPDGRSQFLYVSAGCRSIYELEPEELIQDINLIGKTVHPEDLPTFNASMVHANQTLANWNHEYRIVLPSGQQKWLQSFSKAQKLANGVIIWNGCTIDVSDRKLQENALQVIMEDTSSKTGSEFFHACVKNLAEILQVRYAFVTELLDEKCSRVKMLALWTGEDFAEPYEFNLADTPCQKVFENGWGKFPNSLQTQFPNASDLATLNAESYLGIVIVNSQGKALGNLGIIDIKPLKDNIKTAEFILQLFATRVATEIDRQTNEKVLRQQEQQYRSIFESVSDGIFVHDIETGKIVAVNSAACQMHGYSRDEFLQLESTAFIHPNTLPKFAEFLKTVQTGNSFYCEGTDIHKQGTLIYVEVRGSLCFYNNKPHALSIVRDITERKLAEKRRNVRYAATKVLAESDSLDEVIPRLFKVVCETLQWDIGEIWTVDSQTHNLRCTESWQIPGLHLTKFRIASQRYNFSRGKGLPGEVWESGEPFWLSDVTREPKFLRTNLAMKANLHAVFGFPIINTQKNVLGVIVFFSHEVRQRDEELLATMTAIGCQVGQFVKRKQAEIALRQSEQRLRTVISSASMVLYALDRQGLFTFSDGKGLENLGLKPQQVVGHSALEMYKDYHDVVSAIHQALAGKASDSIHDVNGIWFDTRHTPIFDDLGNISGIIGVALDVSDVYNELRLRKKIQIQLEHQTQQLQDTLEELKHTQMQMLQSEKMSSLGQLVAGIAHEINNPVNFIYGNLTCTDEYVRDLIQLVKSYEKYYPNAVPEIQRQAKDIDLDFILLDLPKTLSSMKIGAERIRGIVLSLRTFSRLDEAECKQANIHEGIDSTLMILQHRLNQQDKLVSIQVVKKYGDLSEVECYAGQLNQVFMNILANAIDALEEKRQRKNKFIPTITVQTSVVDGQWVKIAITDNGIGIPEETKKRIFDPFFTTKPVGRGTGMGMSISYQIIVEKHGGKLDCFSQLGEGTKFAIQIPYSRKSSN
jgi:PAS domain S-box-containing protein